MTANKALFAVILLSNGQCDAIFGVTTAGLAHIVAENDVIFDVTIVLGGQTANCRHGGLMQFM